MRQELELRESVPTFVPQREDLENSVASKKTETETNSQYENCAPSCNEGTSNSKTDDQLNVARCSEKEAIVDREKEEEDSKNNTSLLKVLSDLQKVREFKQEARIATAEFENSMISGSIVESENYLQSCDKCEFASKSKKGFIS